MIGKSHVGKGFYGCYRYVLGEAEPDKRAHVIGGNMAGRNARELSSEVRLHRQRRPDIAKPVWHVPIAFHPEEPLTDAQMQQACEHFLKAFGVDRDHHQYLIVRHHDQAHHHAHIVVNRISDHGTLLDLHRDRPRVKAATRQTEQALGLRRTVEKTERFKDALRQTIRQTAQASPALPEFIQGLEAQGIRPQFAYRGGQVHGIIYHAEGSEICGSTLGRDYSFPGLQRHLGVEYQTARDDGLINANYVKRQAPTASEDVRIYLRAQITQTAQPNRPLPAFCQALADQGIRPEFALRRGKLSKLTYEYAGQRASGAQLGDAYTLQGLQTHLGIDYQPGRDDEPVRAKYMKHRGPSQPTDRDRQHERVTEVAPILMGFLNAERTPRLETPRSLVTWDETEHRLTLRQGANTVLQAQWKNEAWEDQGSALTQTEVERIKAVWKEYQTERRRERQQRRSLDLER